MWTSGESGWSSAQALGCCAPRLVSYASRPFPFASTESPSLLTATLSVVLRAQLIALSPWMRLPPPPARIRRRACLPWMLRLLPVQPKQLPPQWRHLKFTWTLWHLAWGAAVYRCVCVFCARHYDPLL